MRPRDWVRLECEMLVVSLLYQKEWRGVVECKRHRSGSFSTDESP